MQQVICVRAHGSWKPGDQVEMPDGAEYSSLYFAEPGTPEAAAAARAAERAAAAAGPAGDQGDADKARAAAAAAMAAAAGSGTTPKDGA